MSPGLLIGGTAARSTTHRSDPEGEVKRAKLLADLRHNVLQDAHDLADAEQELARVNRRLDDPAISATYPDGTPERQAGLNRYHELRFQRAWLIRELSDAAHTADGLWDAMAPHERTAAATDWGDLTDLDRLSRVVRELTESIAPWRGGYDPRRGERWKR